MTKNKFEKLTFVYSFFDAAVSSTKPLSSSAICLRKPTSISAAATNFISQAVCNFAKYSDRVSSF